MLQKSLIKFNQYESEMLKSNLFHAVLSVLENTILSGSWH